MALVKLFGNGIESLSVGGKAYTAGPDGAFLIPAEHEVGLRSFGLSREPAGKPASSRASSGPCENCAGMAKALAASEALLNECLAAQKKASDPATTTTAPAPSKSQKGK